MIGMPRLRVAARQSIGECQRRVGLQATRFSDKANAGAFAATMPTTWC
jgi:hypothetical protein